MLTKISEDYQILSNALIDAFKEHIRLLPANGEDDMAMLYLQASIDAIATYSDTAINPTEYNYKESYDHGCYDFVRYAHCRNMTDLGVVPVQTVVVKDADGNVVQGYTLDAMRGTVKPEIPMNYTAVVTAGYSSPTMMPPRLVNIIFMYAAHLYENRESVQTGAPKLMPDWVNYALASILKPRV